MSTLSFRAWMRALGLTVDDIQGLNHVSENSVYELERNDPLGQALLFKRASYLCKAATKVYGNYVHAFGSSKW